MPQPLFILCPGRSFSSVVSAMIGQHPQCYGLPELSIFVADTLGEALDAYSASGRRALPGLRRTIAELHYGTQTEETVDLAVAWMEANRQMTPRQVMDHIQDLVGDRILVEKSPANVIQAHCLNRVVDAYPSAHFLQLLRHPRSRGLSHQKAMRQQALMRLKSMLGGELDYEAKWTDTHVMIHDLGRQLPPGQMMRIIGEDLLRESRFWLPQICEWLDIRDDEAAIEAMLHPEESPYSVPGPANAPHGTNSGFLENPTLDFDRLARMETPTLDAPMDWAPERGFSAETRRLAAFYGYR